MFIVLYNDANRNHDQNHSQSTLCKYTFGWELVIRDPMEYAYLDKRWMLHCTVKSFVGVSTSMMDLFVAADPYQLCSTFTEK